MAACRLNWWWPGTTNQMNAAEYYEWEVNIGSGNGLVPSSRSISPYAVIMPQWVKLYRWQVGLYQEIKHRKTGARRIKPFSELFILTPPVTNSSFIKLLSAKCFTRGVLLKALFCRMCVVKQFCISKISTFCNDDFYDSLMLFISYMYIYIYICIRLWWTTPVSMNQDINNHKCRVFINYYST